MDANEEIITLRYTGGIDDADTDAAEEWTVTLYERIYSNNDDTKPEAWKVQWGMEVKTFSASMGWEEVTA